MTGMTRLGWIPAQSVIKTLFHEHQTKIALQFSHRNSNALASLVSDTENGLAVRDDDVINLIGISPRRKPFPGFILISDVEKTSLPLEAPCRYSTSGRRNNLEYA
jgi:hypothetical protein